MCFKLRYLCVVANRRGREFLVDQLLHEFLHHVIGYPGQQIAAETGIEPLVQCVPAIVDGRGFQRVPLSRSERLQPRFSLLLEGD
jgi:hypothetical protein